MLTNERVVKLIDSLPNDSYRKYLSNKPITLSQEMSAALGTQKRQTIKVLATVVDAVSSKLFIDSIDTDVGKDELIQWLKVNKWDTLEREIWKAVVRDGKTYALLGYENTSPVIYHVNLFNGRDGAYIFYSNGKPTKGINTWYDEDQRYLDIYYAERIEHYQQIDNEWLAVGDEVPWVANDGTPLGIALVEFSIGTSDLANGAVQLQDDINFALIDLIATSRTMGWPQRYLKGSTSLKYVTNQYGQAFTTSSGMPIPRTVTLTPGSIQLIGKDEDFNQLDSANADSTVFDKLLHALFIATTVPMHYFTDGNLPSGVALIQAEQRLNHKVESHQGQLTPALVSMITMMFTLSNTYGNTTLNAIVSVRWHAPEVLTETLKIEKQKLDAEYVLKLRGAGVISVEQAVRVLNPSWDESQVQQEVARINGESTIAGI